MHTVHTVHMASNDSCVKSKRRKTRGATSPNPPGDTTSPASEQGSSPTSDVEQPPEVDDSILQVFAMPTDDIADSALSTPKTESEPPTSAFGGDSDDDDVQWTVKDEQECISSDLAFDDADPRELLCEWGL